MKADIYQNARTGLYTIRAAGKVVDRRAEVWVRDVRFPARKRPCARGVVMITPPDPGDRASGPLGILIKPYGNGFVTEGGRTIEGAARVYFGPQGIIAHGALYDGAEATSEAETRPERPGRPVYIDPEIETVRSTSDPTLFHGMTQEEVEELLADIPVLD